MLQDLGRNPSPPPAEPNVCSCKPPHPPLRLQRSRMFVVPNRRIPLRLQRCRMFVVPNRRIPLRLQRSRMFVVPNRRIPLRLQRCRMLRPGNSSAKAERKNAFDLDWSAVHQNRLEPPPTTSLLCQFSQRLGPIDALGVLHHALFVDHHPHYDCAAQMATTNRVVNRYDFEDRSLAHKAFASGRYARARLEQWRTNRTLDSVYRGFQPGELD